MAGKRYGGSLLPEAEKKTKTMVNQTRKKNPSVARAQRPPESAEEEREARQEPEDEDGHEVVDGTRAPGGPGRKPPEMLAHDEEVEKAGVAPLDGEKPGQRQDEEDERCGRKHERPERRREPPRRHGPHEEDPRGQDDRDETLREKRSRRAGAEDRGHGPPGPLGLAPQDGRPPREERGREEERQQAVGQVRAREEESHRRREKEDGGRPAEPRAPRREEHECERAEAREPRRQPRRPGRFAEEAQGRRIGPVQERRLFEVRDAVQARDDEVAGREHLPRDLGVAGFVGLGQARARRLEPDHREQGEERREEGPPTRSLGRELLHHPGSECTKIPAV